jgi:hypothetical protein
VPLVKAVDNRTLQQVLSSLPRYHATMQERFPYEQCQWAHNDPARQRRWYEVLERTGPENVRARLAQTDAGSPGSISIGTEQSLTIGFAQEWLAWHDRQKAEREATFRGAQIYWTRWAAIAASVAAAAAVVGSAAAAVVGWVLKIL